MNPLFNLRNLLEKAVEQEDMEPLRQCLSGKHLPVLGGNEQPADIILRAISVPSFNSELGNSLTTLLAGLIDEGMKQSNNTLGDEFYVYNLFLFASYLPRNPDLFKSLKNCFQSGLKTNDYGNIRRQLRQALTYQQTDRSFEEKWMSYFENIPPNLVQLDREQRGELLEAWQGLLWIPPTDEERRTGQVVSMNRIDNGLKALYKAVSKTIDDVNILRYSIRLLNDSYPRSADFWVKRFLDFIHGYPKLLQDALANQWPMLENGKSEEIPTLLSGELKLVWKLFSSEEQIEIKEIISGLEHSRWESYWSNYITRPAPQGFSPQEWRRKLLEIMRAIESRHPVLSRRKENLGQPLDPDHDSSSNSERAKKRRGKGLGIDRLAAKDMANKVVSEIDKLLQKNDLKTAKRYLGDFVIEQKERGNKSEYIVKTLCNTATITSKRGYFDWSEEIYLQAQEEWPEDVVACTGLAEVLKAQGKFEEAEVLYQETITRWPEDVVACTGLAEVLKAQGKFEEAEVLYQETITRWPEDVVACTGLAEVLKAQGKFEEAEVLYQETITRWPENVVACTGLAEVLKAQGKFEEAEVLYQETITRWPENVVACTGLAEVLKAQGKFEEAEVLYQETITRWPENVVACNGLAEVLKAQGKFEEAEVLYQETITRWPEDVVACNGLAEVLKAQGKFEEAEVLYQETITRWPENVVACNGLAEVLKAQGKFEEAEVLYQETITRWPEDVVAKHGLANVLRKLRRYEEALSLLPEVISFESIQKQYDAHLRCMILVDRGDIESAKSIVLAALKSNLSLRQRRIFDVTKITVELKEKRYEDALKELNTISEFPASDVFRLHALAGAKHTDEANRLHNQLTSSDIRISAPIRNVTKKIEQGYFQRNFEELKTPTNEELDEVIRAEIDLLLALAA